MNDINFLVLLTVGLTSLGLCTSLSDGAIEGSSCNFYLCSSISENNINTHELERELHCTNTLIANTSNINSTTNDNRRGITLNLFNFYGVGESFCNTTLDAYAFCQYFKNDMNYSTLQSSENGIVNTTSYYEETGGIEGIYTIQSTNRRLYRNKRWRS